MAKLRKSAVRIAAPHPRQPPLRRERCTRYQGRGLSPLDLINEGNLGLFKAAKRFDMAKDVKFISYAVWWIRQSIQKALFEQVGSVRIPSQQTRPL